MSVAPLLRDADPARPTAPTRLGAPPSRRFPAPNDAVLDVLKGHPVDERHFMWLLVRNLTELQGYARRLAGKQAEASDLVQETCRRAIESIARFKAGSDMRAWLCCILRNFHRDRLRRATRETLVGDCDGPFPAPAPEDRSRWAMVSDDDLARAMAALRPQYQRAYVLHAIDGQTYGQIATTLRVPASTVGTRILRARTFLREFLLQRLDAASSGGHGLSGEAPSPARDHAQRGSTRRAPGRGRASGARAF
jgi:RNA polymerase sigma-70 factor (ECF subfamily)